MHAFAKKPKGAQQTTPAKWPKSNRAFQGQSREVQPILHLQRTIGNQGVLRFLRTMVCDSVRDASPTPKPATPVQPKLDIGEYDDQYEQEADQVAEQVMKMPAPPEDSQPQPSQYSVQRKPFTPGTQHPPGFAQLDFFSHAPQGSPPTNLLQAKLTIGQPNNVYEQEADRVAAQIMAMPGPISRVQRQPESSTVNPSDVDDDIDPAMSRHLMEGAENLNREEALDSALSQLSPSILESALLSRPLFPGLGDLHLSNGLDEGNSPRAGHTRNAPRLTGLPALSLDRGFEEEYIRSGKLEKDFIKFLVSQAGLIGSIVRAITRDFRRNRPAGYALLAVGAAPIAAALAVNPSTLKRFGPLISSLLLPTGLPWARVQPIFDPKSENFGMVVHFDVLRIFTGQDSQTSSNPVDQNSLPRRPADPQEPLRHPSSPGEAARMNFSEGPMQAQGENDEPGAQVQRSPDQAQPASPQPDLENRLNASRSGGSPLPNEVRQFMEPRFGFDFSKVKVHNDADAVQMNRDLGAQAFAHGNHIYYGAGKTPANDHLTGHELTHVVQQNSALTITPLSQPAALQRDVGDESVSRHTMRGPNFTPRDRRHYAAAAFSTINRLSRERMAAIMMTWTQGKIVFSGRGFGDDRFSRFESTSWITNSSIHTVTTDDWRVGAQAILDIGNYFINNKLYPLKQSCLPGSTHINEIEKEIRDWTEYVIEPARTASTSEEFSHAFSWFRTKNDDVTRIIHRYYPQVEEAQETPTLVPELTEAQIEELKQIINEMPYGELERGYIAVNRWVSEQSWLGTLQTSIERSDTLISEAYEAGQHLVSERVRNSLSLISKLIGTKGDFDMIFLMATAGQQVRAAEERELFTAFLEYWNQYGWNSLMDFYRNLRTEGQPAYRSLTAEQYIALDPQNQITIALNVAQVIRLDNLVLFRQLAASIREVLSITGELAWWGLEKLFLSRIPGWAILKLAVNTSSDVIRLLADIPED